jgi:dipeptidyl aminopeptidase/acylaminoacyl peptidase
MIKSKYLLLSFVSSLLMLFAVSASISANEIRKPLLEPLFADISKRTVRLAPNGEHYVIIQTEGETIDIALHNVANQGLVSRIDLGSAFDGDRTLRSVMWLDERHVAAILIEKSALEHKLVERNVKSKLIIIDVFSGSDKPLIYQVTTAGFLVEPAPSEQGVFYFSRSGHKSKVYRIEIAKLLRVGQKRSKLTRVDGGQFIAKNVVTEVEGFATEWFFSKTGEPVAVLMINKDANMELAVYKQKEDSQEYIATTIKSWQEEDFRDNDKRGKTGEDKRAPIYIPIAKAQEENSFYAMDITEELALSLYLVDFKTDEVQQIYTSQGLPIEDIIYGKNEEAIGVVVVEQGLYTEHYFDETPLTTDVLSTSDEFSVVSGQSLMGDVHLVYKHAHNQSPRYYIQQENAKPVVIMQDFPQLPLKLPSRQIMNTVKVDDVDIPYLLTLPESANNNNPAPIVLMPHGGPFNVYDSPYFDADSQLFAANGIAVLRVNFRGSGGYGIDHRDAGKKQWGGAMLDDLNAAFKQVIKRPDIDASRSCVVGMSYGGYAALMLTSTEPDLYGCGVSVSGVSDMNVFLKSPHISAGQLEWLHEYAGDPDADKDMLKDISPIYKLPQLQRPLLIIHGAQDEIVNVENAYRAKLVLEKHNIPFTFKVVEDAGHHFREEGQTLQMYQDILDFVLQHVASSQNLKPAS